MSKVSILALTRFSKLPPSVQYPNQQARFRFGQLWVPETTASSLLPSAKHRFGLRASCHPIPMPSKPQSRINFPLTQQCRYLCLTPAIENGKTSSNLNTLNLSASSSLTLYSSNASFGAVFLHFIHTMARSWLIDIGGFAKKVKNTTLSSADQIKDCGAHRECPNCHYRIDNSDVSIEWPGLPVGVKFDPSDLELLEHLAGKSGIGNKEPHVFINEFIPTLEGELGICYTHPENLPGAKKDGIAIHFFHRTVNAYTTGQRKRRKIHHQEGLTEEHVRWHKTGNNKPILEDGVHKGFKKIMVLYIRSKKGSKDEKSNWVMHQYHLGIDEDEKDGEYVISKIFYQQPKNAEKKEKKPVAEDPENMASRTSPKTPKPNPPNPPRAGKCLDCDDNIDETVQSFTQDAEPIPGESHAPQSDVQDQDNAGDPAWLAGESQDVETCDFDGLDDILLCKEILDSSALLNDSGLDSITVGGFASNPNEMAGNDNLSYGISVLDTLDLGTPPDFDLSNLNFSSQDSIFDWVDRL